MAAAIRVVTVQRGIDPRGLTLVAFGGAGPMHAVRLAEMFGISSVAVPLAAGVASAVGLVGADLHVELVQTRVVDLAGADPAELEAAFAELADQARAELADEPGTAFEITRVRRRPLPRPGVPPHVARARSRRSTRRRRRRARRPASATASRRRTASRSTCPPRSTTCGCTSCASSRSSRRALRRPDGRQRRPRRASASARSCSRRAGPRPIVTALYDRTRLVPGDRFAGPAVIAAPESTIVVPPHTHAEVDAYGTVLLDACNCYSPARPGIVSPDS